MQGVLLDAARPFLGPDLRLVGASRTDAGVHALGQVASLTGARSLAAPVVQAALNATLPRDVRVLAARIAPPGFDARRAARLKRYGYLIRHAPVAWPFLERFAWHLPQRLDVDAMGEALRPLRGRHDFAAFQAAAGRGRCPMCRVHAVRTTARGSLVGVFVSADAFLHHMVRNIVGSLVEVGSGRRPPEWVADALAGRDRRLAGPTAPPQGLYLLSVRYPASLFPGGLRASRARRAPRPQGGDSPG